MRWGGSGGEGGCFGILKFKISNFLKVVVELFCGEVVGGTKITLRPRKNANDRALIKSKYMHEKYIIIAQVSFIFS